MPFFGAIVFTSLNGLMQGLCLTQMNGYEIGNDFGTNVRFIFGLMVFGYGVYINVQSDSILRNLRKSPNEATKYKIPFGGYFRYVTQANYFGEIVEWMGYAIAGCNLGGIVFFMFTCVVLYSRACASHQWYHKKFDNYPKNRKIIIPFLL